MATGQRRDLTHEEQAAFWSWATVEVLRHTGIRIEKILELTHRSFIAYTLPTTGEVVPMLQIGPSIAAKVCGHSTVDTTWDTPPSTLRT